MKTENEFLSKVKTTINKFDMIKPKHRILIGLSGGPDSICLLHVLNRLKKEFNIKIYAFHLNHKLRGKESEADEKFVKEFCRKLRIPFRIRSAKVKEYAKKNRLSLEQAAREIRYRLLEQEQKRLRCDRIGLGHNADDNA
ncbi:MAG: tRNA lysidine(34) synthetase TilS, partial [candidate division WOR-3 bacterium]|nr:tRNA lysidine(34) synthetase TilS [candidate division WOR-3 bacterium]